MPWVIIGYVVYEGIVAYEDVVDFGWVTYFDTIVGVIVGSVTLQGIVNWTMHDYPLIVFIGIVPCKNIIIRPD